MSQINSSRRKLLQQLSTLPLAASTTFSSNVFSQGNKKKLGVALVGLGYYSRDLLAPALQLTQHCELKGIVTGSPEKIPAWQRKYGIEDKNVYNYENMHQVANNPDIDVLYIVVPTSLHKKYSVIAANAGKHVWCEKPMAMTESECKAIMSACEKNKVKLTVGYRLHHEPNTQTVMRYAKDKPFGKMQRVIAEAGNFVTGMAADNWRLKRSMGGGALYDIGVYPINAARYATGAEPIAVSAVHQNLRPEIYKEVDEFTFFTLFFPGDVRAHCAASVGKRMNKLRVECESGWYKLEPMMSYKGVTGRTSTGELLDKTIANQQAAQMDNDALAIIHDKPVLVSGEQGLNDIRIVEMALKSAAQNGKRLFI